MMERNTTLHKGALFICMAWRIGLELEFSWPPPLQG